METIILNPSEFQDTLKLASAGFESQYFQDFVRREYPEISLSDEDGMYDMWYLYQEIQATTGEEISETYKAILTKFSFEKQQEYLQRMNAEDWKYIIEDQYNSKRSAQLLDKSTEAFHRYASSNVQNKVLSYFLDMDFCRNSVIGSYAHELSNTPIGRQTLKVIGQNFTGENNTNVIQYMCGLCDRYNRFTETDWLHLADYYDTPKLIEAMMTDCTASRGWDKITPASLINWCQQRSDDFRKDTVAIMISEWASHHIVNDKIDRHDNLSLLYSTAIILHRADPRSAHCTRATIIQQMNGQLPSNNNDQQLTKKQQTQFKLLTERQWYKTLIKAPELLPYAIENRFGTQLRPRSFKSLFHFIKQRCIEFFQAQDIESQTKVILNYYELYPFILRKWEPPVTHKHLEIKSDWSSGDTACVENRQNHKKKCSHSKALEGLRKNARNQNMVKNSDSQQVKIS